MALETGTYISDLVTTNPVGTDTLDKADDHLRLIKSTVKATFPNITGAVTPTHTDLNKLTASGSPQFSTIELGNASDTTITRSAAGVIAVEGGVVPKENRANTFSADQTINANLGVGGTPTTKLDVKDATVVSRIESTTGTNTAQFRVVNTGGTFYYGLDSSTGANFGAAYGGVIWHSGAYPLLLATNNTERVRISSAGDVGIGGTSTTKLGVFSDSGMPGSGNMNTGFSVAANASSYAINIGSSSILGYSWINSAFVNNSGVAAPLVLATGAVEKARVDASGNLLVTSTGGLGYGTGSGGTVTQITSRTTGVTLNKTNGSITMFTAAGSTAWSAFTVTNSTIAATDTVILSIRSGASNTYLIQPVSITNGNFTILFATTGGTASDAPVINFSIIKAVTA